VHRALGGRGASRAAFPRGSVGAIKLQALLQPYFEVHVFEHDYQKLIPWDGRSGNALFACVRR